MADSDEQGVPGNDPGPVPEDGLRGDVLLPDTEPGAGDGGLRWSFGLDLEAMLAAIGRSLDVGSLEDQEEIQAAQIAADDRCGPAASPRY